MRPPAITRCGAYDISCGLDGSCEHRGAGRWFEESRWRVSGKEAGLGGEAQIHIVVTATASCVNPGDHHPKAANKTSVTAQGTFPVQNGKADFSLTATATFKPDCTPPMTVVWSDITVTDTTNGISVDP